MRLTEGPQKARRQPIVGKPPRPRLVVSAPLRHSSPKWTVTPFGCGRRPRYEIQDISRFPKVGNFISYARLVKCPHESAGRRTTGKNAKIGNVHLKWAFSEAACLFLRANPPAKHYHQKLVSKYGNAKALSIIAQKLGRVAYSMLRRRRPYDAKRFFETVG